MVLGFVALRPTRRLQFCILRLSEFSVLGGAVLGFQAAPSFGVSGGAVRGRWGSGSGFLLGSGVF